MQRRDVLKLGIAGGCALGLGGFARSVRAAIAYDLRIQPAQFAFKGPVTKKMVSLSADAPPPVLYGDIGQPMVLNVTNTLPDYTAMHWHGLRIPNGMDGVPYLTQFPIGQDETFRYKFTPPDAGTYWYHPHCMTMDQMAKGLTGVMVIREAVDPGFDGDQILNLRDFRLDAEAQFLPSYTARGAARSGTFGNLFTANWQQNPSYDHPAGGLVRLRIANTDTTRVHRLFFSDARLRIIAWDGHPIREDIPMPSAKEPLFVGPGQRADVLVQMPRVEGGTVTLYSAIPGGPFPMAQLRSVGSPLGRRLEDFAALPDNPVAMPDLENAERHEFVFGWSPEGDLTNDGLCGTLGYTFWSINRKAWPGDAAKGTGPLAVLERGKSYVLRLRNECPNMHPIHLHGLLFVPLGSNKRTLPANWSDALLLQKDEIVDIALVADNPGDWAFHCHVIEHQKTGLAGYIRVL